MNEFCYVLIYRLHFGTNLKNDCRFDFAVFDKITQPKCSFFESQIKTYRF